MPFLKAQVVQLHGSINTVTAWEKSHFIWSERSDFHMVVNHPIAVDTLLIYMLKFISVDEILLPMHMDWSTNFRALPFNEKVAPSWLKHSFILV